MSDTSKDNQKWSNHLLRERKGETSVELLEQILSNQNMNEAYLRVYKNKGANGIDAITVDELKQYLKENKDELHQRIRTRKYQPQAALRVEIPKENGKMRKLGIPTVVDNVEKSKISRPKELKFLEFGYYYYSKDKKYQVKPHSISLQKFQCKLRKLTKRSWSVPLDYRILKLKQVILRWVNYFRISI